MLTFPIYLFTNKISKKKIEFFLGGYPPYGPLKNEASQKLRPMTAHSPYLLLKNPILIIKRGVFAKKLDLNILKMDWAIAILGLKIKFDFFLFKFWEIILAKENSYNSGKFFVYMITDESR